MVIFHLSLSERKSSLVSRTLLSILVDLSNAEALMVSILPLNSNSLCLLSNPLGTVPSALTTISINVLIKFGSTVKF